MYKQTVVPLNRHKYIKASPAVLDNVLSDDQLCTSFDDNYWICKTCDGALSRGKMPVQAKCNGLELSTIPPELSCLNPLELRLISLRVPFMKMVALPSGKQRCIHGPAVNVPSKLDSVCTTLPRLPSQSELIPLKFKRKLAYKGHYMYDYVTPEKVLNALRWLKVNNPLYANVEINDKWSHDSENSDFDLHAGLLNHTVPQSESAHPQSSHSTQLNSASSSLPTSNAGEVTTAMTDEMTTAVTNLLSYATHNNFSIHDVPGDGNCLFNAVLYQLKANGTIIATVQDLRQMVASYLEDHSNFYMNFTVVSDPDNEPPNDEDAQIASLSDPETTTRLCWENYLGRLRNDAWGDHLVISALSDMFSVTINVHHANEQTCTVVVRTPTNSVSTSEVNIGLILQYHFVGLDRLNSVSPQTSSEPPQIHVQANMLICRLLNPQRIPIILLTCN